RTRRGVEADRRDPPDLDYCQPGRRQDHHHAPGHHHAWPDLGRGARRRRDHRRPGAHRSRPRGGRRPAGRPGAWAHLADENHVQKSLALLPRRWVTLAQGALPAAIIIATGSTLQALALWALLRRHVDILYRFRHVQQVVKFVALSALGATIAPSVALIALSLLYPLPGADLFANWRTWWQGDTS